MQRISRLTPLDAVLALIDSQVHAVPSRRCALASAQGATLAEDVMAPDLPSRPIALRDGFAVASAEIADAGAYTPVALTLTARRIDAGGAMPNGTDAVLPLDAVTLRGKSAEATAAVSPGEGVLPAGGDASAATPLRRAGEILRALDCAVLTAAGISELAVHQPRIRLVCNIATKMPWLDAALAMLARLIASSGGAVAREGETFEAALKDDQADAVIAIGGTGSGRRDTAVQSLGQFGRVEAYGIALSPGETSAFGFTGKQPVLLIPGRLDAALAIWLLLGRYLVAKLAGGRVDDAPAMLPLKRKVTSTIGMSELIPVRCIGGMAEPLGSGYLSLAALAAGDGWITVGADSEGFAEGTQVAVRSWP